MLDFESKMFFIGQVGIARLKRVRRWMVIGRTWPMWAGMRSMFLQHEKCLLPSEWSEKGISFQELKSINAVTAFLSNSLLPKIPLW